MTKLEEIKKYLGYVEFECPNCKRMRVEKYQLLNNEIIHICEKCNWCIETKDYEFE